MTREEKQLLLKDLCGRLPYGVVLNVPTIDGSENKKLVSIVNEDDGVPCAAVYSTEEKKSDGSLISYAKTIYAICDVLPYLRPMSSITDEEWKEFEHLVFGIGPYHNEKLLRYSMKVVDNTGDEQLLFVRGGVDTDWFNAHHFDYRGLIEKGLALEAPEGMYKAV